jgi:hypothetical protein
VTNSLLELLISAKNCVAQMHWCITNTLQMWLSEQQTSIPMANSLQKLIGSINRTKSTTYVLMTKSAVEDRKITPKLESGLKLC